MLIGVTRSCQYFGVVGKSVIPEGGPPAVLIAYLKLVSTIYILGSYSTLG